MRQLFLVCLFFVSASVESAEKMPIRFVDVTAKSGIAGAVRGMMGHGGAWGDFDGDGLIDLYVGGFCDRPNTEYAPAKGPVRNCLLRNRGDGKFQLVDAKAASFYARTSGAVFADLNNDGTLELYVANNAKPRRATGPEPQRTARRQLSVLLQNDTGKLIDISRASGAVPAELHTARNIGVFDYNNDGLLDLLVIEDRFRRASRSVLLQNLGGLRFKDVTTAAGLPDDLFGLGLAVADLNADGRPDFFVGHSNRFFISRGKDRYFEPKSLKETFAWKPLDGEDWPCGAAFGDLNNDGRLDMVLGIHCERARNRVYLNEGVTDGVPRFRDVTKAAGFPAEVPQKCPHVEIQDFDNDGRPDVYFSAGWLDGDRFTPLIFRNTGVKDGVPQFEPPRKIAGPMVYYPAGPSGDYDNDGRVDLFLINWFRGNTSRLMHNESPKHNWLQVEVQGRSFNRMGIGSQIHIYKAGNLNDPKSLLGFQEVTIGYGYASGQPAICNFGLGEAKRVDVSVQLPNGKVLEQRGVATGRRITIEEPHTRN